MTLDPQRRPFGVALPLLALIAALILAGCAGSSGGATTAKPVALRLVGATLEVSPKSYSGACGATQNLTFTATLTTLTSAVQTAVVTNGAFHVTRNFE